LLLLNLIYFIEQMAEYSKESLERIEKLESLKKAGVIPYANKFEWKMDISSLQDKISKEADELMTNWAEGAYRTAGRLLSFRSHGKLSFAKIQDNTSTIQICFVKDKVSFNTGKEILTELEINWNMMTAYKLIDKMFDVGDIVGIIWDLFVTKHGELTIFVKEFQMMSKAIRPLPEKFHGITDQETLYRQRYLDLITNDDTYNRFLLRSKLVKALRDFYDENGFIEIETPVMWNAASGAAAAPFFTHHNDYDHDFVLRISPETNLKKATVWRFERIFEIWKQFRNEGSDPSHMQEFTSVEHYAVYWNFEDNMRFTEEMFEYVFAKLDLPKIISIKDKDWNAQDVDFTTPWERIDYIAGVKEKSGINIEDYGMEDEDKLREDIKAAWHNWEGMDIQSTTTLIDYLYKKVLRPGIIWPAFVYNYPKTMQPLARASDEDKNTVEQFQLLLNGWEILKAYSELVDPIEQQNNFDDQAKALAKWDEEATSGDEEFVLSMEYGMPPQSGWGMGIDRILTLLTWQENLRDGTLFPLMKPLNASNSVQKSTNYDAMELPSIEDATALVEKYATFTKNHLISVGYVMKYFANKLWENEQVWQLVGLLHDIDRDYLEKNADKHCKEDLEKICSEINLPAELIEDIRAHAHFLTWVEANTLIKKYIASVDEITGFIWAISRMMPNKTVAEVKVKSVKKKIKSKSFAAGVSREELKNCETMLDISLDEFIPQVLEALVKDADKYGMDGIS